MPVIKELARNRTLTQRALRERVGASGPTVFRAVSELLEIGVVRQAGEQSGDLGRPASLLGLAPEGLCVIAVEVHPEGPVVSLVDAAGHARLSETVDVSAEDSYEDAVKRLSEAIGVMKTQATKTFRSLAGVGVSFGGSIDSLDGSLTTPSRFQRWHHKPLAADLRLRTGLDCAVDNDATGLVKAVLWHTTQTALGDFVLVNADRGVGLGISINGAAHIGRGKVPPGLAHVPVAQAETRACRCGRQGCLETVASAKGLMERARQSCGVEPLNLRGDPVAEMDALGDPNVDELLQDAGRGLAESSLSLARCLDIGTVIFAGAVVENSAVVRSMIEEAFAEEQRMASPVEEVLFLGDLIGTTRSGLLGASAIALDRLADTRVVLPLR